MPFPLSFSLSGLGLPLFFSPSWQITQLHRPHTRLNATVVDIKHYAMQFSNIPGHSPHNCVTNNASTQSKSHEKKTATATTKTNAKRQKFDLDVICLFASVCSLSISHSLFLLLFLCLSITLAKHYWQFPCCRQIVDVQLRCTHTKLLYISFVLYASVGTSCMWMGCNFHPPGNAVVTAVAVSRLFSC